MCLLMARQVRVCLGRPGHRQPQWRHQRSGGLSPRGFRAFRQPRLYPQRGNVPLYGEQKPWGVRWWTKWIANIESARREGAEMEVYFLRKGISSGRKHSPMHVTEELKAFRKSHLETLPLSIRGRYSGSFWRGFQRKNATSWRHLKVLGIHRRPK